MAAKKSRDWRSGKREGRSRMVQMTRHLVVTEGKETEPRYFGKRGEALQRAGRLVTYHRRLGNVKPSAQNPATKVGEIFNVIGPYLVG